MIRHLYLGLITLALTGFLQAESPAPVVGQMELRQECPGCEGKGKLVLVPPDYGQHRGRIESKNHWNIRLICPICDGKEKLKVYRLSMPPLTDGTPPCSGCGWTGVERCRKCSATGLIRCKAPNCKNGWNITKYSTSNNGSSKFMKTKVTACPECKGLGKIMCPDCEGKRGILCRKCNGLGRGKEKK